MKPEQGSSLEDEMDEIEKDPREFLQELVLEVLEGRTPDPGSKGRVEGPHCPRSWRGQSHVCSARMLECQRLASLEEELELLWKNQIPACMDVLLYPDCTHGQKEAGVLEVNGQSVDQWTDNCLLLERWMFKFCQKRHMDKSGYRSVGPVMLLQAVKSYLHFSQLSSWLLSSGGCLPLTIVYRLYAPGENVNYEFEQSPDLHKFPNADLEHYGVKVSVSSLPRREMVTLNCKLGSRSNVKKPGAEGKDVHERKKNLQERQRNEDLLQTEGNRDSKKSPVSERWSDVTQNDINERQEINYKWRESERWRDINDDWRDSKEMMRDNDKISQDNNKVLQDNNRISPDERWRDDRWREDQKQTERGRSLKRTRHHQSEISRKRENRRYPQGYPADKDKQPCDHMNDDRFQQYRDTCPVSLTSKGDNQRLPGTTTISSSTNSHSGIRPEQSDFRESYPQKFRVDSPSRNMFLDKPLPLKADSSTSQLQVSTMAATSKCLHSPKVLMTSNTKPDQMFKKKCLDLSTSSDSDEWDNPYVSMKIQDLTNPLSPTDIQTYLASLQTVACTVARQGSSDPCVTPKCKFYVGTELDLTDNGYQSSERKSLKDGCHSFNTTTSLSNMGNARTSPRYAKLDQVDLDSVTKKLEGLSPFRHSESPPSKKEKRETLTDQSKSVQCKRDSSETNPTNKTCKRKLSGESLIQTNAKCSSLDDSGLVTGEMSTANGHSGQNGVVNSHDASVRSGSPQNEAESQTDDNLCNNCDKPINMRLSYLRKFPTTPTLEDTTTFQRHMTKSASMMFSSRTGLPTQSSPAPIKRKSLGRFDYDSALTSARAIKNAISCSKLVLSCTGNKDEDEDNTGRVLSTSAPASTNCLLGNFEESVLNGRIEPIGAVDGFTAEIGASGSFCPKHVTLPVTAYFFKLSDDNAPSPYLGHINMESLGKRGYHIPKRGTVQVTLFNPNKTVVKMFVVMYDLSEMPANCQTFLRQRTLYMPVDPNSEEPSYLRYLIHLRFATSKSSKVYLHTDIRLIFARDKFEFDPKVSQYELRSFNEGPINPKFSPKR